MEVRERVRGNVSNGKSKRKRESNRKRDGEREKEAYKAEIEEGCCQMSWYKWKGKRVITRKEWWNSLVEREK